MPRVKDLVHSCIDFERFSMECETLATSYSAIYTRQD